MKGTEKQIEFARILIKEMNEQFDMLLSECPEDKKSIWKDLIENYNNAMETAYAGDVIDLLINQNKDSYKKYYVGLYYKIKVSADPLSMKIKKEIYGK